MPTSSLLCILPSFYTASTISVAVVSLLLHRVILSLTLLSQLLTGLTSQDLQLKTHSMASRPNHLQRLDLCVPMTHADHTPFLIQPPAA